MLLSDRPIASPAEDLLGFQPFCLTLARGLNEMVPIEGLVVALHAPWGSGKTSALNLIERNLAVIDIAAREGKDYKDVASLAAADTNGDEAAKKLAAQWEELSTRHGKELKTKVIRFNPWYFSGQESLFKAFFGVLGTHLDLTKNGAVAKAVGKVLKRAEAAGSALGLAIGLAAGPAGASAGKEIGGFFGKMVGDKFDQTESLDAVLNELKTALSESPNRFLVVIDDIDRLLPEELRQLLTLIKSVGNLPNVTYLLAFDRQQVVSLIKQAGITSADYLEKIVQVSFELPRVDRYALRQMLFPRLDTILGGFVFADQDRWSQSFYSCIDPYLRTPRDVTRLCNALQITWPAVKGEVDWTDLVVLEVLRLHEPTLFNLIVEELEALTGTGARLKDDKEWAAQLLPSASNSAQPSDAREALVYLFPKLAELWDKKSAIYHQRDPGAAAKRRIQSEDYARNYFTFSPGADQFTTAEINRLFVSETVGEAFTALYEKAKTRKTRHKLSMITRLLEQIRDHVAVVGLPIPLTHCLLANSDEIIELRDTERTLFAYDNELRLSSVLLEGLRQMPDNQRLNETQGWFKEPKGGPFLVRFIEHLTRPGGTESTYQEKDHATLRELAAASARSLAEDTGLLSHARAGNLLFAWAHLTSFEEVKTWIARRINDTDTLINLAQAIPSTVSSSARGEYVYVHVEDWSKLLDLSEIRQRLGAVKPNEQQQAVIDRFEAAMRETERQSRER